MTGALPSGALPVPRGMIPSAVQNGAAPHPCRGATPLDPQPVAEVTDHGDFCIV